MSKPIIVGVIAVSVLLVLLAVGAACAQGGPPPAGGAPAGGGSGMAPPTAPMGGPASGPPGMALPKDVVQGKPVKTADPAKSSKTIWIIAGAVVLVAVIAFVATRKKA